MHLKKLYRAIEARDIKVDMEARTMEFPFSSEYPVERYFGKEILSHEKSAIDLERADLGAIPLLFNHNMDDLRGKAERVWLGNDKRLYCKARFANTEKGNEALALCKDGMLPNVSFGYIIEEMMLTKTGDMADSECEYTATKWAPYEVSLVTVPADPTVGVGRSSEDKTEYPVIITKLLKTEEIKTMSDKVETPVIEASKVRAEGAALERTRIVEISALGEKFKKPELARKLVEEGTNLESARTAFLEAIATRQEVITEKSAPNLGLSDKEKSQYSYLRAIQALANPGNAKIQAAAGYEREVSDAASKLRGKESQGLHIPHEVLSHRDLSKGTPSAGGYLVGTQHMPEAFIEIFRKKSALSRAGVRSLMGLQGDIAIPKQTGGATAYWVGEGVAPTESQQTFGQVAMSPKTVGAFTDLSRKLIIQSSPDVENLVKSDLATVLALAVDLAGIYGLGSSGQPLGITNTASIKTKDLASANSPTFLELIDMESLIAADDADVEAMKYILNAKMRGYLKGTVKFANTDATLWEAGNMVNGYPAVVSNQMVDGDILFGNFADLMMGYWSGVDLTVDTSALSTSGGLRVIVLQDLDVAVRHASSFCFANANQ